MANSDEGTSSRSDYQVFLNFRGPDTREGFTDVLFHSLIDAGICVFRDDEELRVGQRIDESLERAIDNSKIYIPIFSRTYASSQWCLYELARIMENTSKSEDNKEILPIFLDVEPNDVKLKTALYSDAILSLQRKKELSNEQVEVWRKALMEVDAIKGWEVKKYYGYGKLIKLVVEEVVERLKTKHRSVTEHLVGIDDGVVAVSILLDINFDDVRLIQIHGLGGIGKTTLAKVVFNQFSSHFGKCCCFLEDVRAKSSRTDGLVELQRKLLSEISHPAAARSINEIDYGMKRIGEVLRNKKVLLVLDDVDKSEQVENLVGNSTLCSGSRIFITTRNKDVLQIKKPKYRILKYEMEVMSIDHALELLSRHAFNRDSPSYDYNDLARKIVSATGRLPLALEVIGSFLHNKTQELWIETLDKLSKAPHEDVFEKLKISYDALSCEHKEIFLDIACFFIGEKKTNATYVWRDCDFFPATGIAVLISMSLVKIVEKNKFWMHDQLRDLGREIVRRENPMNPRKRSRLWIHKDILDTITTEEMKENVQTLDIDLYRSDLKDVKGEDIGRFENLRCLKLNGGTFVGNFANCLTKLRWIFWSHPPPTSKSTNMHFKNVVVLRISYHDFMDDSKLQNLIEMAIKLKVLLVESCPNITRTPKFSGCQNLERLTFKNCSNLKKIDSSIGKLKFLIKLKIAGCNCLEELPEEIGDLVNLEHFFVDGFEVKDLPNSIWKLKSLHKLRFLPGFDGNNFGSSWELPSAIGMLQNLEVLIVNTFTLKGQIPPEIGSLPSLRILDLSSTKVSEVPKTVGRLPCLERLKLRHCSKIQELPILPTSLTHLFVSSKSLQVVSDLSNLTNLVELSLNEEGKGQLCTSELRGLGKLPQLTKLSLGLRNVPATELASLHLLKELSMFGLDQQTLPQLPLSLQRLGLNNFNLVESIFPNLRDLLFLELFESPMQEFQLDGLQLPHLSHLVVQCCGPLQRFRLSNMTKLTRFVVRSCPKLVEIPFSCSFELLEHLCIEWCASLERLVYEGEAGQDNNESIEEMIICGGRLILPSKALKKLQIFELAGCLKISEIHVVDRSESWEVFQVLSCHKLQIVRGLSNLKNLWSLCIKFCKELRVVEDIDELEFLNELLLSNCGLLEWLIDESTTKLPNDCHIDISECKKICGVNKGFEGSVQSFKH